jgi:methylenetetrahydromethanopterin dehydrogenase
MSDRKIFSSLPPAVNIQNGTLLSLLDLKASMFKIGFIKLGNIATSLAIDLALDEIAERTDIEFKVVSFGPKMTKKEGEDSAELKAWGPQLVVVSSPNAATAGPTAARELFKALPTIVISDGPTKKEARDSLVAEGFGYIILPVDPLIGAKREFLDSAEMALFNSDALKVLAACGAVRLVQEELDRAMDLIAMGETKLPAILATPEKCAERMDFKNPYARAKAVGALHMAQTVASIDAQACFKLKDLAAIALAAAAGHEVMRAAARLADEARELEKSNDSVSRKPHARSGELMKKTGLLEKPEKI